MLADTLRAIAHLDLKIEFRANSHDSHGRWCQASDLASPGHPHLGAMLVSYQARSGTASARVAASVLMLRFGWVSGFAIAPYLVCSRVPKLHAYGLAFPPSPGPGP